MKHPTQQARPSRMMRTGLLILAAGCSLPGCASLTNMIEMRSIPVAGPNNPVIDFACIWQQGEGRDQKGMPSRGFCGQLLFTTRGAKKPGIVNGNIAIYVFDNVGTPEEQAKPFEVFNFTAEEWATFSRKTNLGMSYQLFIPYTRPGGREADCQIHVKYTPIDGGSPIMSHPETIALRGAAGAASMADALDRKLMNSSPLFAQSPLLKPAASDAAYKDLMQRYQNDARLFPQDGTSSKTGSLPASTSAPAPAVAKGDEIQRLKAILDESSAKQVSRADYSESASPRNAVRSADYETEADGR